MSVEALRVAHVQGILQVLQNCLRSLHKVSLHKVSIT